MRFAGILAIWITMALGCASSSSSSGLDLKVRSVDGRLDQPLMDLYQIASVLIFVTHDCPISNGYAPQINKIIDEYSSKNIRFSIVHVDRHIPIEQANEHAAKYAFVCPILIDDRHDLVRFTGATVTPEAAVYRYGSSRPSELHRPLDILYTPVEPNLAYLGRIDDRYTDFGKRRAEPSKRDLREALDAIIAGHEPPVSRTKAIGCPIPQ